METHAKVEKIIEDYEYHLSLDRSNFSEMSGGIIGYTLMGLRRDPDITDIIHELHSMGYGITTSTLNRIVLSMYPLTILELIRKEYGSFEWCTGEPYGWALELKKKDIAKFLKDNGAPYKEGVNAIPVRAPGCDSGHTHRHSKESYCVIE